MEIDGKMVERVMVFNYLGVNITSSGNLIKEIKPKLKQARQAAWMILSEEENIWEIKMYKANVRPMMTYTLETRAVT